MRNSALHARLAGREAAASRGVSGAPAAGAAAAAGGGAPRNGRPGSGRPGSGRPGSAEPGSGRPGSGRATGLRGAAADTARPLLVAGASAACAAAGIGLAVLTILVVIGWVAAPHPGIGLVGVLRTAAVVWLAGHHVAVHVSGAGRIGMLPLGLVLVPGALLWRAGRSLVRGQDVTGLRQVAAASVAVAVPYALLAGALALASRSRLASASVPQAVLAGFVIAAVAVGFGAARALAPWHHLGALMSARTRSVLAGAAGSLAVLTGAGAMATGLALASGVHEFAAVYQLLDPGIIGACLLLLAQLAYLPNAMIWAIAYMLGPGFAVGSGTVVAPTGSVVGALPAFPLLAALPVGAHGSVPGWLAATVLAVPYLAGVVGGLIVVRMAPTTVLEAAPMRGFCSGVLTGGILGAVTAFAGGPLGDGRMSAVGPSAWQVTAVAGLEVGIAAAITAGAVNWRYLHAHWPAIPSAAAGSAGAGDAMPGRDHSRPHMAGAEEHGHVLYLDRWANEEDEGAPGRRRAGDPSALP